MSDQGSTKNALSALSQKHVRKQSMYKERCHHLRVKVTELTPSRLRIYILMIIRPLDQAHQNIRSLKDKKVSFGKVNYGLRPYDCEGQQNLHLCFKDSNSRDKLTLLVLPLA